MKKKILVVSAVNLVEGGTLTILRECLNVAVDLLGNEWDVVAIIHNKKLLDLPSVTYIEYPLSKRSWLLRLYYEWFAFRKLSRRLNADLWLSLHDITPSVLARRQSVYCHNPAPFYKLTLREILLEPTLFIFNKLYGLIYRINIHRNHHVVVQQSWLRDEFQRRYNALDVVVAHPIHNENLQITREVAGKKVIFFFPSLSRVFKNFEVICNAVCLLNRDGVTGFEVRLTIDGSENRYSASLLKRYLDVEGIHFIGRQNKDEMDKQYEETDCLIFPSRLETWGLPISEAKSFQMPMFVADLPYAHETVGSYDKVRFFPPNDATALANLMSDFIVGEVNFIPVIVADPSAPFAQDWPSLLRILTEGL